MKFYKAQGDLNEADCVIGFSFGTSVGPDSVNVQLGTVMLHFSNELPLITDRPLANAIPNSINQITHVIEGEPTHGINKGLTT